MVKSIDYAEEKKITSKADEAKVDVVDGRGLPEEQQIRSEGLGSMKISRVCPRAQVKNGQSPRIRLNRSVHP